MNQVNPQKTHYESIHSEYEQHYFDQASMEYRERFLFRYLLKDIDLANCKVADLACGSGQNSALLKKKFSNLSLQGFDISEKACSSYRALMGAEATEVDLTKVNYFQPHFDAAIIIGGLHHCISDLNQTLTNIHSMLKPGAFLFMMEPNADYFLDGLRRVWYKNDRYFEETTEEALSHEPLLRIADDKFELVHLKYFGGPAYFLILNSLLFRLPYWVKRIIKQPMFLLEMVYNKFTNKRSSAVFVACWRKRK